MMPSSAIHRCVSKRVREKLNIYNDSDTSLFYELGSVAPDCWKDSLKYQNSPLPKHQKRRASHFSTESENFIEDYNAFYQKYHPTINDPFLVGYFVHLITDNYWRTNMFLKYFLKDNKVKMLDGTILTLDREKRKELLSKENKQMSYQISKYYNLQKIRYLSTLEIASLPKMEEVEFNIINDTVEFINFEANNNNHHTFKVYNIDNFINGVESCSDFIIDQLIKYKIVKK